MKLVHLKITLSEETIAALDLERETIPRATYAGNLVWKSLIGNKINII